MGGIGNVATDPDYRGRGLSTQLLKDVIRVMKREGFDFSVLFTGICDFYARLGWRSVPIRYYAGNFRTDQAFAASGYIVRPCVYERDLPALEKVHESFNRHRSFTTIRTPEYWRGYVLPRFGSEEDTLVAERGGSVVGYVYAQTQVNRRALQVQETGCLCGHEDSLDPLFRAAASRAAERGARTIEILPPEEPAVLDVVRGIVENLDFRETQGTMCMVLNMRSIGRKILPELQRRAKKSKPPCGSVSLDTEMGRLALSIADAEVSLGGERPTRVPISQSDFFCLLLGIKDAAELGIEATEEAGEIVSALFAKQRPVFWLPDHF
jgi:predicted N-acetyltransferase YhbS